MLNKVKSRNSGRKTKMILAIAASVVALQAQAQWTKTGAVIAPTVLTDNVSVGTTVNGANIYAQKTGAVNLGIKSTTASATMFMDKGGATANAAFAYKTLGTTLWNSGMLGNNNFSIKDVVANTLPFVIQQTTGNVGIGTNAPTAKLHVNGTALIFGKLTVSDTMYANTLMGSNFSVGNQNTVSATGFAFGSKNNSSGILSFAAGYQSWASGSQAIAMGYSSFATAPYSVAIGERATASSYGEVAVGTFNTLYTPAGGQGWDSTDRVFTVGNGDFWKYNYRSDAMVILKNGNVGIGTSTPTVKLHVVGNASVQGVINTNGLSVNSDATLNGLTVGKGGGNIINNTAVGLQALYSNTVGGFNTAIGNQAMYSNIDGIENTATGSSALSQNTAGNYNTATGCLALSQNTMGGQNTAVGHSALALDSSGSYNTACGYAALYNNKSGHINTAIGQFALGNNITGSQNTAIGFSANVSLDNFTNAIVIGTYASVNSSNKVRLGNTAITVVEGQVGYSFPSDARFKENVQNDVKGLEFILKLQPVSYNFNRLKYAQHIHEKTEGREAQLQSLSAKRSSGFLAQDVEKIVQETGYTAFDAVHAPTNETDNYSLGYAEFVVPLVKAVQELSLQNDNQQKQIDTKDVKIAELQNQNAGIQNQLNEMNQCVQSLCASAESKTQNSELQTSNYLFQNQPNPFNQTTVISYQLLSDVKNASIVIRGLNGEELKTVTMSSTGKGQVTINANQLAQGTYTYTLIVNGKSVDTKLMVVTK